METRAGLSQKDTAQALQTTKILSDFIKNSPNNQLLNLEIVQFTAMPNSNKRIEDKQPEPSRKKAILGTFFF